MFEENLPPELINAEAQALIRRFVREAAHDGEVRGVLTSSLGSFIGLISLSGGRRVNALLARNADGEVVVINATTMDGKRKVEIRVGDDPSIASWNKFEGGRKNSLAAVAEVREFITPAKKGRRTP